MTPGMVIHSTVIILLTAIGTLPGPHGMAITGGATPTGIGTTIITIRITGLVITEEGPMGQQL